MKEGFQELSAWPLDDLIAHLELIESIDASEAEHKKKQQREAKRRRAEQKQRK